MATPEATAEALRALYAYSDKLHSTLLLLIPLNPEEDALRAMMVECRDTRQLAGEAVEYVATGEAARG